MRNVTGTILTRAIAYFWIKENESSVKKCLATNNFQIWINRKNVNMRLKIR